MPDTYYAPNTHHAYFPVVGSSSVLFYREDFVIFVVMLLNIMTIMIIIATIYGGFTMCQVLG